MPRYEIEVISSPQDQPPETAGQSGANPTSGAKGRDKFLDTKAGVALLLAWSSLKQVGQSLISSVATLTGNSRTQRLIQNGTKVFQSGVLIAISPLLGVASASVEVVSTLVSTVIERNQQDRNAERALGLRGNSYKGGR